MTDPTFSLIFVNYQSFFYLARSLHSWRQAFGFLETEFIVVNNDEKEKKFLEQLAQEQPLKLVHCSNIGFGSACNVGSRLAQGKYLFFLNPDTEYLSGSVGSLREILEARPFSVGGVKLVDDRLKDEAWSAGKLPNIWRIADKWLFGFPRKPYWGRKGFDFPHWVSGAALAVRKDFFDILGGFDEKFFLYFEDVDFCHRVRLHGGEVWRTPFFTVKHSGGSSHAKKKEQKRVYYQSQEYYFSKYRPVWEIWLLKLAHRVILR